MDGQNTPRDRERIYSVFKYFSAEKENGGPLVDVSKASIRTADATNVSISTVERVCREARDTMEVFRKPVFEEKKRKRSKTVTGLDDFDKVVLRRKILQSYERKELPTIEKVLHEMKENIGFKGSRESLRKIMREIGFRYAKVNVRRFLMERHDVQCTRARFLEKMHRVRERVQTVIYLDETWVNQNYSVGKCRINSKSERATGMKVPTGKGSRLIILHAGSKEGFVPDAQLVFSAKNDGDYHHQMNHVVFEEWFSNQLLPNIPSSSVIVMDNAPYHSRRVENPPTTSSNKATIKEWLVKKGLEPKDNMLKCHLLEMVQQYSRNIGNIYVIDKIAEENGHKVIRLTPYHCHYNPIELIWGQVKNYISKRNNFKMADLKLLVNEAMASVTTENWANAVNHAERLQAEDAKNDVYIDKFVDSFITTLESSDSSDEESL
ncbi:uncharacterized protein [Macrobrachium rosenbergii]|uniref:uncharacterized protein n=1 Tax=Macrobrachium rosenbergii TaxID=79674 RepID=UPI0034D71EB8